MEDEMSTLVRRSTKGDPNSGGRFIYTSSTLPADFVFRKWTYVREGLPY